MPNNLVRTHKRKRGKRFLTYIQCEKASRWEQLQAPRSLACSRVRLTSRARLVIWSVCLPFPSRLALVTRVATKAGEPLFSAEKKTGPRAGAERLATRALRGNPRNGPVEFRPRVRVSRPSEVPAVSIRPPRRRDALRSLCGHVSAVIINPAYGFPCEIISVCAMLTVNPRL